MDDTPKNTFEAEAEGKRQSLVGEFWDFLKDNKKWWLLPIIIVVLLFTLLVVISGSPLGSFIYTVV